MGTLIYILDIMVYSFIIGHKLNCYKAQSYLKIEERNAKYVEVGHLP